MRDRAGAVSERRRRRIYYVRERRVIAVTHSSICSVPQQARGRHSASNSQWTKQLIRAAIHGAMSERRYGDDSGVMCRGLRRSLVIAVILLVTSTTLDASSSSACDDHSVLEFDDVASLTVLSAAVFDGRLVQNDGNDDVVTFRVGQVYKGAELFPVQQSSSSAAVHIAVRLSSTQCARSLRRRRRRRRFLVFLNGSLTDSNDDERQSVYWSTAAPVRFSKRSVKIIKRHSCSDCGMSCVLHDRPTRRLYVGARHLLTTDRSAKETVLSGVCLFVCLLAASR